MSSANLTITLPNFPLDRLPKELRLQIWTAALPAPRIVYVQRRLYWGESPLTEWGRCPTIPYFSSPSPCNSIVSLLKACTESHSVVMKHYTPLFGPAPIPLVWFDYSNDYLFLDWGTLTENSWYLPKHFKAKSPEEDIFHDRWGAPHLTPLMTRSVRKLVVGNYNLRSVQRSTSEEEFLVRNVLQIFSGVETVVYSDLFFSRTEMDEELAWLIGSSEPDTALRVSEDRGGFDTDDAKVVSEKERSWLRARKSLLWRDTWINPRCIGLSWEEFNSEWARFQLEISDPGELGQSKARQIPKVFKNSIVTAAMKKRMLKVFGSEENFHRASLVDWQSVEDGETNIKEDKLGIPEQIDILELALGVIVTDIRDDSQGYTNHQMLTGDINYLIARIDALKCELDLQALIIAEAEETP